MILRKNKTKFRRPAHKGSLKARHGAEIRIAVPVPGEVSPETGVYLLVN